MNLGISVSQNALDCPENIPVFLFLPEISLNLYRPCPGKIYKKSCNALDCPRMEKFILSGNHVPRCSNWNV